MQIAFDPGGTVDGLRRLVEDMSGRESVKGLMILAADENDFEPGSVDPILAACEVPLFGGTFPQIIHQQEQCTLGTIVVGLAIEPAVLVVPDLSEATGEFDAILDALSAEPGLSSTMFVLVDGFSSRISVLIESLFNVFGLEPNFIGGGAGSLSFVQKPCLLSNSGMLMDAALVAHLATPSGVGVCHGWETIEGPFRVTASDRNVILSLEHQPALDVYRKVVEEASGQALTDGSFFEIAKRYPFGIGKFGTERIVRDPVKVVDGGGLMCVGEVPRDSVVYVLTGDEDQLVAAAGRAFVVANDVANDAFPGSEDARSTTVFFDCISRVLFLGEQFHREVSAVYREGQPLIGAMTIGEIANSGKDYLEFYNKTSVVGVLKS